MSQRYPIPAGPVVVEDEIKKSRFITHLAPVGTVDEANAFIQTIRAREPEAGHHCYAFLVGPPGTTTQVGMSNDGEPHNSAGRPMLNVLTHCDLGDVAAVVTRYWGGTKLGKGGLVRAYSGGVQHALDVCGVAEKIVWETLRVTCDYAAVTALKRMLPDFEATIEAEEYGEKPLFSLKLPSENTDSIRSALTDLTNGGAVFD